MKKTAAEIPMLVVSTGHTFDEIRTQEGDFDDWIVAGLRYDGPTLRMDARLGNACLPKPDSLGGVVVTGSHAMVTEREPWSERLAAWLKECVEADTPLLGICYGHQLLAHAMGGRVAYNPRGMELGTREIRLSGLAGQDALFGHLPGIFPAQLVHAQSVLELPQDAVMLAANDHDRHQAFRIGRCAWGVQFHPEFSASAMRAYIRKLASAPDAGARAEYPCDAVLETPAAHSILGKFGEIAAGHGRI